MYKILITNNFFFVYINLNFFIDGRPTVLTGGGDRFLPGSQIDDNFVPGSGQIGDRHGPGGVGSGGVEISDGYKPSGSGEHGTNVVSTKDERPPENLEAKGDEDDSFSQAGNLLSIKLLYLKRFNYIYLFRNFN